MANKLKYFIGNWKMFGNQHSISILNRIHKYLAKNNDIKKRNRIVFCVPYTLIDYFYKNQNKNFIEIGAQNCHHIESSAPYTGGVNATMIKNAGSKYVILGHSENRSNGETNLIIKKKVESALKQNLNIIFCIGETKKEKKSKKTFKILRNQIRSALNRKTNPRKIIIAYEPVWSIGTGKTPNVSDLLKIINFIKFECFKIFKSKSLVKTLYGGSVNGKNVSLFSTIKEIDGFLIGGASQSSNKFIDIINNYYK